MPIRRIPPDTWAGLQGQSLAILISVMVVFWSATSRLAGAGGNVVEASLRTDPPAANRRQTTFGAARALYRRYCQRCHAANGTGSQVRGRLPEIPDFTSSTWHEDRTDAQLRVSILEGRGISMPGFSGPLTERQGDELVSLIRAFNPQPRTQHTLTTQEFDQRFQALERELELLQRQFRRVSLHRHSRVLGSFNSRAH